MLWLEALHAGRFDERAVTRDVFIGDQVLHAWLAKNRRHEPGRDGALKKPVPVFCEHRCIPDWRVHGQANEPTEHQVIIQLLHELTLRANRREGLQQKRPEPFFRRCILRRYRGAANLRIQAIFAYKPSLHTSAQSRATEPQELDPRWPGSTAADDPLVRGLCNSHQKTRFRSEHPTRASLSPASRSQRHGLNRSRHSGRLLPHPARAATALK